MAEQSSDPLYERVRANRAWSEFAESIGAEFQARGGVRSEGAQPVLQRMGDRAGQLCDQGRAAEPNHLADEDQGAIQGDEAVSVGRSGG